jgi:hypothetical protein
MATYQKWEQSYAPKVTTIKLTYRGVKYNKMCASSQSVHYSTHYPWFLLLLRSGGKADRQVETKTAELGCIARQTIRRSGSSDS